MTQKSFFCWMILAGISLSAFGAQSQNFIDCSEGNPQCDMLYTTDEMFSDDTFLDEEVMPKVDIDASLARTNNKPLAFSLPDGATYTSDPDNPLPGTVIVPNRTHDSQVDVLPDGSVKTVTHEVETMPTETGYQEKTRTVERLEKERSGAMWVAHDTNDKVAYGQEVHDWDAVRGETLRSLLTQWAEASGWTLIWKLDRDYNLEAGVVFRGTFTEVSSAIIRTFARAVPAPIGTFYKGNRVLVISVQEDENAH